LVVFNVKAASKYFFDILKNREKGSDWYGYLFVEATARYKMIGDVTPTYFWNSDQHSESYYINPCRQGISNRINCTLGKPQLVLILRNPILRAISAYFHHANKGRIDVYNTSILDVVDKHGIASVSMYTSHLENYLKYFDLKYFHVAFFENIKHDKLEFVNSIYRFSPIYKRIY
jgi:hypothetical protein